ncbi:MAG: molybdopterin converting factor subunit 1 [Candidatus Promineifilaceae bacterium]|nr:molybdopterin converting factor subunit 1 [Candidatus Promineifilaceae bacterium]
MAPATNPVKKMDVKVRLFATLKDRAGQGHIQVSVPETATVETLLAAAANRYPELAPALDSVLVAVNKAFADEDTELNPGDEVALFPPVSGGNDQQPPTYFAVSSAAIDLNDLHQRLLRPDIGAIVTFSGSVRGETQRAGLPPETRYLEYEAYREMAIEKMAQIAAEIWERWPLVKGVAIVQRVGKLTIGETTTIVACAAAHRDQGAFEAARYGIDRLKQIVPVWKKEVGRDHSEWIEGDYRPSTADNR